MAIDMHIAGIDCREHDGDGPVLVCLHGIGSDGRSFDPLAAALPSEWRVLAWSAPGYGNSPPLSAQWPLAGDYADALAVFLNALGIGRCHLLGHSLGTLIAAAFAVRHGAMVDRLVLASCAIGHGTVARGALSEAARQRLADFDRLGPPAFAEARAPRLVDRPQDNPCVVAGVERAMRGLRAPGYRAAVRMLSSGNLIADVGRLTCPTTVIVGANDAVTPPAQSRAVYAALPAAQRAGYIEIPDCGHAVYQQQPVVFAEHLKSIVEEDAHV
jgi:pimeloyl-ACP methyl ester carboxylesterase